MAAKPTTTRRLPAAKLAKTAISGQRDARRSDRPRQSSNAAPAVKPAAIVEVKATRNALAAMKSGCRQKPSHKTSAATTGQSFSDRPSKTRQPCQ